MGICESLSKLNFFAVLESVHFNKYFDIQTFANCSCLRLIMEYWKMCVINEDRSQRKIGEESYGILISITVLVSEHYIG